MAKKKKKKTPDISQKVRPENTDRAQLNIDLLDRHEYVKKYLGPILIGLAVMMMAWWSWGKWSDPMIDFGRELYIPWQITEGNVLYKDIAYFNGPLSPYVNSLLFFLFGVHMRSLIIGNFIILGLILFVSYKLLKIIGGRTGATIGCLVLVTVFAFARYHFVANYNFIAPYSHEMTHGLLLSLLGLYLLSRYQRQKKTWGIFFSGVLLGLVFLTKAEFTLAAAAALISGYLLRAWIQEASVRKTAQNMVVLISGALVPPLISLLLLSTRMPIHQAFMGTLGSWPGTFNAELRNSLFYKQILGTYDLVANLKVMGVSFLCFALLFLPAALISASSPLRKKRDRIIGTAIVAGIVIISIPLIQLMIKIGPNMLRPLPMILMCMMGMEGMAIWKNPKEENDEGRVLRFSFYLFSLMLLAKMFFRVEPNQYGFVLAMPATVALVSALVDRIPALLKAKGRAGDIFRFFSIGIIILFTGLHLLVSGFWYRQNNVYVKTSRASFYTDIRGYPLQDTIEFIEKHSTPEDTLAVIPEGVMLNFLTRRKNPTPYINFMPPEFILFGEQNMIEALSTHPPDFIVLTNKPLEEYGFTALGIDFGKELYEWIHHDYNSLESIRYDAAPNYPFTEMNILRRAAPEPR